MDLTIACPSPVGFTPLVWRSSSLPPISVSKDCIWRLSAGWVIRSRTAARFTLPSSITVSRARMRSIMAGRLCASGIAATPNLHYPGLRVAATISMHECT